MEVDILAFGAHPDDVELGSCGTLIRHIQKGGTAGIIDLTGGELGSRGDVETRRKEARSATEILGLTVRENLQLRDGFFRADEESLIKVIEVIRRYRPKIILANAMHDRHPDHGRAGKLVSDAAYLSGLLKIKTSDNGEEQLHWRPVAVYHYVQDYYVKPDVVVDETDVWEIKMKAIKAFSSQFYGGDNDSGPVTPISSKSFLDFVEGRAREWGRPAGIAYGEAFTVERAPAVSSLFDLI